MSLYLDEAELGRLDIGRGDPLAGDSICTNQTFIGGPYIVTNLEIGAPVRRQVLQPRALTNGLYSQTRWLGGRSITFGIYIDRRRGDVQELLDALLPYTSPARRPRLAWKVPGSTVERSAIVEGVDHPVTIGRGRTTVAMTWLAAGGLLEAATSTTVQINPSSDVEQGRSYDLTYDRSYPPSDPIGARTVINNGNQPADWVATIFGPCTNPTVTVNGVDIDFDPLTLVAGQSIVIDSRNTSIRLNGDPAESRYSLTNYTEWEWQDVRLQPGVNGVRYGDVAQIGNLLFTYRDTYL
jgi:hypothetical protein